MVPLLTFVFARQGFAPEHVVHMAVATATATILFTSLASMREHQRHRAILWPVVAALAPGHHRRLAGGTAGRRRHVVGAAVGVLRRVRRLGGHQHPLDRKPKPTRELPGKVGLAMVGGGIGLISSMVGAGGAFLTVPFMTACNVPMRNCVATSAALGLPIAAAATIGFVTGRHRAVGTAAPHDRLRVPAGAVRDRRGERDLGAVRRTRGAPLARADAQAGVRVRAVRARRVHAVAARLAVRRARAQIQALPRASRIARGRGSSGPCPSRCAAAPSRTARVSEP